MKYRILLLIIIFIPQFVSAQVGYVESSHRVYDFLDRQSDKHLISNYDNFIKPKLRSVITEKLLELKKNPSKLNRVDQKILDDLLIEFEFDAFGTTDNYSSLISENIGDNIFSEKEKHFYFSADTNSTGIFVKLHGSLQSVFNSKIDNNRSTQVSLFNFGGSVSGYLYKNLGFKIYGSNGTFSGDKDLALTLPGIKYNYKFNRLSEDNSGDNYFDEAYGYLAYDLKYATIKIGRDRVTMGYGPFKSVLSDNSPLMDYVNLEIKYKLFSFTFFHAKLMGTSFTNNDPISGSLNVVADKFLAYHRMFLNLSNHFKIGIAEGVIYSNRGIDLSYLNPFNFYKTSEHANQDRDNTFLSFDVVNNSLEGLKISASVLIDDIDFSKISTKWYGNKLLYDMNIQGSLINDPFPIDFRLQYLRINPYVFSHRINENNYSNNGYNLSEDLNPNSHTIGAFLKANITYRLRAEIGFQYTEHGNNIIDEEGIVIKNVGGDINLGHRVFDETTVEFLDGDSEYFRKILLTVLYEPINNYEILFNFYHSNISKKSISKNIFTSLTLNVFL